MCGLVRYPDLGLAPKVGDLFPVLRLEKIPGDLQMTASLRVSDAADGAISGLACLRAARTGRQQKLGVY